MQNIAGVLRCPDCQGAVTAWRGHMYPLFEVDAFDPYQLHRCNPLVLATIRQAEAMEQLAAVTADRNALRAAMTAPSHLPERTPTPRRIAAPVEEPMPELASILNL